MLCLSRKRGERIIIGDGPSKIVVTALKSRHTDVIRVGVEAPPEIPVHREEVYDRIQRAKPTEPPTNGGGCQS